MFGLSAPRLRRLAGPLVLLLLCSAVPAPAAATDASPSLEVPGCTGAMRIKGPTILGQTYLDADALVNCSRSPFNILEIVVILNVYRCASGTTCDWFWQRTRVYRLKESRPISYNIVYAFMPTRRGVTHGTYENRVTVAIPYDNGAGARWWGHTYRLINLDV